MMKLLLPLMAILAGGQKHLAYGEECVDKLETCADLDPSYYCTRQFYAWGYENCRLYCGLCSRQPPSVVGTIPDYTHVELEDRSTDCIQGIQGTCDYKGQHYMQGETWTDGCQYNCSCLDASIGYYRCKDLCPKYTNLTPGCHLHKAPGECCSKPTCNMGSVSTIKPLVTVGGTSFCMYSGQYYAQDETWLDGCAQACTCTDASRGFYSCRAVCLRWDALPSVCHLEDAPQGLCCQQPRCPSSIQIQIPMAYKDQYPCYNYV